MPSNFVIFILFMTNLLPLIFSSYELLFESNNLNEYHLSLEENPGGGANCSFNFSDIALIKSADHIEVISNVDLRGVYVNAIAGITFIEEFPSGQDVDLSVYKYSGEFKLHEIPRTNVSQVENGQSLCWLISIWDGRDELYVTENKTMDFAFFWVLNAWDQYYKNIMVYTGYPLSVTDTGLTLEPDLNWHSFEFIVDYTTLKYVSIQIDDGPVGDIGNVDFARVKHDDWASDERIGFTITSEALALWPGFTCDYAFRWSADFKNAELSIWRDDTSNGTVRTVCLFMVLVMLIIWC